MGADVCRALARVAGDLAEQAESAGVRVLSVDAAPQFFECPVSVVEVSVHVDPGGDDGEGMRVLAGSLGLSVCADEVRPGVVLSSRPTSARRFVTWSGWHPDASSAECPCPVLWRLVTSFEIDRQTVA